MFAGFLNIHPSRKTVEYSDPAYWFNDLNTFRKPDREGVWRSESACLHERRIFNAAANRDTEIPLVCPETGVALAFWGRLDNRESLAAALHIPRAQLATLTDGQLALACWSRWDDSMAEHLLGDFALAVIDAVRRRVFLARDPLGVKPLYYRLDSQGLAFATSVSVLRDVRQTPATPDSDWMARYLLRLSMSDRDTAYREIVKLPPGHTLMVSAGGQERLHRYHFWWDDAPPARRRESRWVDAYRAILEESIRCRMDSDYPLGTENSGGLDSATITAYLAHLLGEPGHRLHSFGFALCEQEPAYILETSQATRIIHNYIVTAGCTKDDYRQQKDRALRVLGYPEEHGNASGHTPFYRECELHGIRSLFSGFGGDEVVTNPGYLLRWELQDQGEVRAIWDILQGNIVTRGLRLGRTLWLGKKRPEYNHRFLAAWRARWPYHLLREEVVTRLGLHAQYMETARYDAPYRRINDFILEKLLTMPYIATRLENCTLMAASHGIDYRWPLWDVRLVQQYLSTPSIEKVGPQGISRYLHRRAIAGVVPKRVTWKPSKDMGDWNLQRNEREIGSCASAEQARLLEADLHPALDELIDRPKLMRMIQQAAQGRSDEGFSYAFKRGVMALDWLDRWLKYSRDS